jgi:hypothetical protein
MGNYTTKFICYDQKNFNKTQAPQPSAPPAESVKNSEGNFDCEDPSSIEESPEIVKNEKSVKKDKIKEVKQVEKIAKTEKNIIEEKRIKPKENYEKVSNMKTIILLQNLCDNNNNLNYTNLLKGKDRAIIDRRHVYAILISGKRTYNFILDYACNTEFLLGLELALKKETYEHFSQIFRESCALGINGRNFEESEKYILGNIIYKVSNGKFTFKNMLLDYI